MTTRRALIFAALASLSAALVPAAAEMTGALQVTYYYLPG